jgi:hypothetical protein
MGWEKDMKDTIWRISFSIHMHVLCFLVSVRQRDNGWAILTFMAVIDNGSGGLVLLPTPQKSKSLAHTWRELCTEDFVNQSEPTKEALTVGTWLSSFGLNWSLFYVSRPINRYSID